MTWSVLLQPVLLRPALPYHVLFCPAALCLALSHPVFPCHSLSLPVFLCHSMSCPIAPCLALPLPVFPCHSLSCLIAPCLSLPLTVLPYCTLSFPATLCIALSSYSLSCCDTSKRLNITSAVVFVVTVVCLICCIDGSALCSEAVFYMIVFVILSDVCGQRRDVINLCGTMRPSRFLSLPNDNVPSTVNDAYRSYCSEESG